MSCSFCDSKFTWDASRYDLRKELIPTTAAGIMAHLPCDTKEVVITGGEPLMHQGNPEWVALLRNLYARRIFISVETNGTIAPDTNTVTYVRHYSISPKLANAGSHKRSQDPAMAVWPAFLREHRATVGTATACLKFVVEDAADVVLACKLAENNNWDRSSVWVMPEGTTTDVLLGRWPEICAAALEQRVNCTQRLHVLAWGDTRGT